MNFNWKYLVFDLLKVAVPLVVASLLPETAPQVEIIEVVLYIFSTVLGIDAVKKTISYMKAA